MRSGGLFSKSPPEPPKNLNKGDEKFTQWFCDMFKAVSLLVGFSPHGIHALALSARQTAVWRIPEQKEITFSFVKVFEGVGNFFQKVSDIASHASHRA